MTDLENEIFPLTPPSTNLTPPPPRTHTHTHTHTYHMDMRINERRNVFNHARVNFSPSETSSLLCWGMYECMCGGGVGGAVKILVTIGGGGGVVNRKDPKNLLFNTENDIESKLS